MKKATEPKTSKIGRLLPRIMLLLICLQPVLDIVSYWQTELAIPISLSFAPRAIVFAFLFLGGLFLSEHKKAYWIMLGTVLAFWACHLAVCLQNGMTLRAMINDTTYYISVLQLPVTAISMITCLRLTKEEGFDALLGGFFWSLMLLLLSFLISWLTNTEPHTYPDSAQGICGYCFWPNAQSAILSMCAPVSIAYILRKKPEKTWLCIPVIAVSLSILYLHGTRLSYLCMLMTGIGMLIVLLITKQKRRYVIAVAVVTAVFAGIFYLSPMFLNRSFVSEYTEQKDTAADKLTKLGEMQIRNGSSEVLIDAGVTERKTGMQAFAVSEYLTQSDYTDMELGGLDAQLENLSNPKLEKKNSFQKAYIRIRNIAAMEICRYQEQQREKYTEYIGYVQTLDLINSADKLYNYYPFAKIRVVDILCSATVVYEKYTGTAELTDWQDAGVNWHDVFIERAKRYNYDGRTLYVDNPWNDCTRAEAAELIYRMLPVSEYPQIREIDSVPGMSEGDPFYDSVLALYRAGVINDLEDGKDFRAEDYVNRLSYAAWLAAAVNPAYRICDDGYTVTLPEKLPTVDPETVDAELRSDATLFPMYNYFLYGMVDRFGIRTVAEEYERTVDTEEIINERAWKLHYCYILMDQSTPLSRLFGLEADRMLHKGYSYDVENDVHAIYLRFGWVGVALMCAFLLYFVIIVIKALIKNPKQIFTLEAGAIGIALLAVMAHAYYTCGVLRRANTLYYFGVLLAGAYYLVKLKEYPQPDPEEVPAKKAHKQKKKG